MKNIIQFSLMVVLMLQISNCTNYSTKQENEIIANKWQSLQTLDDLIKTVFGGNRANLDGFE